MVTFWEVYQKAVKENGCNAGVTFALSMFRAGADWQSKQMAWVSVNDKMPEEGHVIDSNTIYSHTKNVIVLYKNGCIGKGKRIYVNEINKKGWQWSCLKGEDITQWMYCPE